VVTEADLRMLSTLRGRRAARLRARSTGGAAVARAVTEYQLAATELALVHQRAERGVIDVARFDGRCRDLLALMTMARDAYSRQPAQPG
jgi:hypothetical protein